MTKAAKGEVAIFKFIDFSRLTRPSVKTPLQRSVDAHIAEVNWTDFDTAYNRPNRIPALLRDLVSASPETAITAATELWSELCHQHAYVSSAALPSYPVIIKVLMRADDNLARELLDIVLGFTVCSGMAIDPGEAQEWVVDLRNKLIQDLAVFDKFTEHNDEEIHYFSNAIVKELTAAENE